MFIQKVINLKMAVTNVRTWEKQEIDLRRLAWDFGSAVLVSTAARSWELPTSRRRVKGIATIHIHINVFESLIRKKNEG